MKQKRILIVEDDVNLCIQLSDLLYEFGFETGVADNGFKALEILQEADPLPDVILLDLHMPQMDGWQFRERLKQEPRYSSIQVIIISGDEACREVEADGHFMKPLDIGQILTKLQ
jgi:CheY-like chemotaxis protein